MATTYTVRDNLGALTRVFDVSSDVEGPTSITIPHGLAANIAGDGSDIHVHLTPLSTAGVAGGWIFTGATATNVTLERTMSVGAELAAVTEAQLRVYVQVPHSMLR